MKQFVRILAIVCLVPLVSSSAIASEATGGQDGGHDLTHMMMILVFQLGVIIIAAKAVGEVFERFLRMPAVLGELAAGLVIGPYALGGLELPLIGAALFPEGGGASAVVPVSAVLYGVATVASIVLLFLAGLETDFKQFIRYAGPGGLVGIGGVLGAFITGDLLTVWFGSSLGHPEWGFMSPVPLFMGTISVATSVGITARVLSEKGKLDTPEGVTILSGAVIDDVLGIIVLAIVGGLAGAKGAQAGVDWGQIGGIATRAFGVWLGATAVMIALAKPLRKVFEGFRGEGAAPAIAFGLALLLSGMMESARLAMIIGAYVTGLALAKEEKLAHRLEMELRPLYNVLVPVFFCVMGMLVSFDAMRHALVFGLVFSVVAVLSKVIGCALPTYLVKFNTLGALRVGFGMLPRGEVALIVAGYGLANGIIGSDMFGVSIMMTLITTVMAPPILVKLFEGGPGVKGGVSVPKEEIPREIVYRTRSLERPRLDAVLGGIVGSLRSRTDFNVSKPSVAEEIYLVTATDTDFDFEIVGQSGRIEVHANEEDKDRALAVFNAALQDARSIFEDLPSDAE